MMNLAVHLEVVILSVSFSEANYDPADSKRGCGFAVRLRNLLKWSQSLLSVVVKVVLPCSLRDSYGLKKKPKPCISRLTFIVAHQMNYQLPLIG